MKINLVYFSPSGTGKKTLKSIAKGFPEGVELNEIDLTISENRMKKWNFKKDELVLFAMLTASNLLGPGKEIFESLIGNNTPVVPIVMYGNGFYGNSLITATKKFKERGFIVVAGGAFIGQHACNPNMATGRPDAKDQEIAKEFGNKIFNKVFIEKDLTFNHNLKVDWPKNEGLLTLIKCGVLVLKGGYGLENPPKALLGIGVDDDKCIRCQACVRKCPKKSLELVENKIKWTKDSCMSCYGCVNICPKDAIHGTNKTFINLFKKAEKIRTVRREPLILI